MMKTPEPSRYSAAKAAKAPESRMENDLYAAWQQAEDWEKPAIEIKLFSVLRAHASKVCWMVLRDRRPDVVDEVVEDAIMELHKFEGRSQFATWFHSRAFHRFNDERRKRLTRKEIAYETLNHQERSGFMTVDDQTDQKILVQQMLAKLSERDRELVKLRFFEGHTTLEIAEKMGVDENYVENSWRRIKPVLRSCYGARK